MDMIGSGTVPRRWRAGLAACHWSASTMPSSHVCGVFRIEENRILRCEVVEAGIHCAPFHTRSVGSEPSLNQSTAKSCARHRRSAVAWPPWGVQVGKPANRTMGILPAHACTVQDVDLFCFVKSIFTAWRRTRAWGSVKARAPQNLCVIDTAHMHGAIHTPGYMSVWMTCDLQRCWCASCGFARAHARVRVRVYACVHVCVCVCVCVFVAKVCRCRRKASG